MKRIGLLLAAALFLLCACAPQTSENDSALETSESDGLDIGKSTCAVSDVESSMPIEGADKESFDIADTNSSATSENEDLSVSAPDNEEYDVSFLYEPKKLMGLISEADKGAVLVNASGQKIVPDSEITSKLLNNIDSFVETSEGHLYDGIIEFWLIYGDGTVLGMYSTPIEIAPDKYSSCAGRMYGAKYHIDDRCTVVGITYGYLPIEATSLPLGQFDL